MDLANNKKGAYRQGGCYVGSSVLSTCMNAIGHPIQADDPVGDAHDLFHLPVKLSAMQAKYAGLHYDCRGPNVAMNCACETLDDLAVHFTSVMGTLQQIDPTQHYLAWQVCKWRKLDIRSSKAMAACDKDFFYEGREFQFNPYSLPHLDSHDVNWAWALAVYFHTSSPCRVRFPQINTKIIVRPGDFCAWRGKNLVHYAEPWDDGERNLLVHFTHEELCMEGRRCPECVQWWPP